MNIQLGLTTEIRKNCLIISAEKSEQMINELKHHNKWARVRDSKTITVFRNYNKLCQNKSRTKCTNNSKVNHAETTIER